MPSKQVTDRKKESSAVAEAAKTHATEIAAGASAVLGPYLLKGEAMPDIAVFVNLVGRYVKSRVADLVVADDAHEAELADDGAPREARDVAADLVRGGLTDLRNAVDTAYGPSALTKLGLGGAVSSDPVALSQTAHAIVKTLLDETVKLPKPRRASLKLDRKGFAAEIAEHLPDLDKALGDVAREAREAEGTLLKKRAAMESSDAAFRQGAGWLEATADLAGFAELAARIRPSRRSPGRTAATAEGADAPPATGAKPA